MPRSFFEDRNIELDFRGPLTIEAGSEWGFDIHVITRSHNIHTGTVEDFHHALLDKPVVVRRGAWICSNAVLYNCIVESGAVVACGAVVRSCHVKPDTMVAGNPARVVARFRDGAWQWCEPKWTVLE